MNRIYKSRKKRRNRTKKKKVFRKRRKLNKKSKRRRLKKKKRTQKGGSVRRVNPLAPPGTIRVADKWVAGSYGPWIGAPHFINWPGGAGRQSGTTSIAVRFIDRDNGAPDYGRVHLYGTALPQQTYPAPVIGPWGAITAATDPRNPANWGGAGGLPANSRMWRTMAYFMYAKGVKKWISHQGCSDNRSFPAHFDHDGGGDMVSCQGNPNGGGISLQQLFAPGYVWPGATGAQKINAARAAANTWRAVRNRYPLGRPLEPHGPGIATDGNWHPLINATIQDMTAGRMRIWHSMNEHVDFHDPANSTVIHCLAGWGRTGSSLFFYILRNWFSVGNIATKQRINHRHLNTPTSLSLYDSLRRTANLSLRWDDMHHDYGTAEGMLPARVTVAHPIDRFANAHLGAIPIGRGPNGDWERPQPLSRTSDLVHEVFALYGRGGNFCADIFISRINIILVNIWIYLYLTDYPGSIPVATRGPFWNRVFLYRKPSAPVAGAGGAGAVVGWPAGSVWDRCSPRDIFGPITVNGVVRDPQEAVLMDRICGQLGLVLGASLGGHITKPWGVVAGGLHPIAPWENVFGLDFS